MIPTQDPGVIQKIFQELFDKLFEIEELKANLQGVNKVVMIKYDHPEVVMYLEFKDDACKVLFLPEGAMEPHATLEMDWATAHKLWSGTLDLIPALLTERVRVAGEVEQLVQLKSMYGGATKLYLDIISRIEGSDAG